MKYLHKAIAKNGVDKWGFYRFDVTLTEAEKSSLELQCKDFASKHGYQFLLIATMFGEHMGVIYNPKMFNLEIRRGETKLAHFHAIRTEVPASLTLEGDLMLHLSGSLLSGKAVLLRPTRSEHVDCLRYQY